MEDEFAKIGQCWNWIVLVLFVMVMILIFIRYW